MSAADRFPVLEVFGPTVQGEGMVVGRKTMFIRTAGCDYSCSWCDSAFTWDGSARDEIRMLTAAEILEELRRIGGDSFDHVTISGGNPALLKGLGGLVELLHAEGVTVALETQGSRWQPWLAAIDDMTLSPKPPSSGMGTDWDVLDHIVARLSAAGSRFCLKVVVFDEEDLFYAREVHERYPGVPFYLQAGNDNLTEEEPAAMLPYLVQRYEWLIDAAMGDNRLRKVHVLPQLHTWVWGNKKGV
ncbi:7-carboxy-7-deazaguanine synthase QueE [Paenibacillus sp. J5C_2022]|uniref:7-carboxy-7-deazaguanine synthase QueE n=1 Tax=Paenibacillus sp. J5C2022 TaxID=2977129 RepID=UPI0021D03852|nr:7-carboxy-7-deazaguanine synthase QueE [Paenibacillus sp. J5C2022]MCU6707554.1 7-carboxy-7-deazaguanine synthase QueE [Paenibacillus sp. J5C2022]